MTRIKVLLLVAVMTAVLLLSGCELFHNHKYVWVNGDDPETARQECIICGNVLDRDSLYVDSIQIISSNNSSFTVSPLIPYEIAVNAGKYGYDEEFNITLTLKLDECRYYEDGPFCVKLAESEYYEILSEKEYVIPNFNVEKADELKSMTYHFTVKAIDRCNLVEHFDFKIKFVPNIFLNKITSTGWILLGTPLPKIMLFTAICQRIIFTP